MAACPLIARVAVSGFLELLTRPSFALRGLRRAAFAGLPAVAGQQASEGWSQWSGLNRRPTVYEIVNSISRLQREHARHTRHHDSKQRFQWFWRSVEKALRYAHTVLHSVALAKTPSKNAIIGVAPFVVQCRVAVALRSVAVVRVSHNRIDST